MNLDFIKKILIFASLNLLVLCQINGMWEIDQTGFEDGDQITDLSSLIMDDEEVCDLPNSFSSVLPATEKKSIEAHMLEEIAKMKLKGIPFDVYRSAATGNSLLHTAIACGSPRSLKIVLTYLNEFKGKTCKQLIDERVLSRRFFCVKQRDAGKILELRNNDGDTALHLCMRYNDIRSAKILLNNKANVNAFNNEVKTPLDVAYEYERFYGDEMVNLLTKNKWLYAESTYSREFGNSVNSEVKALKSHMLKLALAITVSKKDDPKKPSTRRSFDSSVYAQRSQASKADREEFAQITQAQNVSGQLSLRASQEEVAEFDSYLKSTQPRDRRAVVTITPSTLEKTHYKVTIKNKIAPAIGDKDIQQEKRQRTEDNVVPPIPSRRAINMVGIAASATTDGLSIPESRKGTSKLRRCNASFFGLEVPK